MDVFNKNRNFLSGRLRKPPRISEQATEGAVAIADYPKDLLDKYIMMYDADKDDDNWGYDGL